METNSIPLEVTSKKNFLAAPASTYHPRPTSVDLQFEDMVNYIPISFDENSII
jgi:hypothetical protein